MDYPVGIEKFPQLPTADSVQVIHGTVAADGTILGGSGGFTVTLKADLYTLAFDPPFRDGTYTLIVGAQNGHAQSIPGVQASRAAAIQTVTFAGKAATLGFSFIAIGVV